MSFFSDVDRELVVTHRTELSGRVVALELAASNGRPLPAWQPGAHIDLVLGSGVERQYSLCSSPDARDSWRVAILREDGGRGGSAAAHRLAVGDRVRARGPRSNFALPPAGAGERVAFVAGGIGITPILPMVHAAARAGADWTLDYAAASRDALVLADELAGLGDRVRLHVSDEGTRADLAEIVSGAAGAPIVACGPERLLAALEDEVADPAQLHTEPFTASELPAPVWAGPFEVEVASTGDVLTVSPDESVLEALERGGVFAVSSCREGTCGTCETVVIDGEVDHRDRVLTEGERETSPVMMVCVSRAACPRLVLDV
ncbi:PDR/VanB family oxidoreductase [Microbacterium indicum]|uniref:PDR/VanB family oxidoreductase n=1 Tax=Microbacterium indicum TaxID=358100 RepID=UPI00040F027C|nr:PDR/VanB family oxidoreductase [Microbacterium indicum]